MPEEFSKYTILLAGFSFIMGSLFTVFILLILEMLRAAREAREALAEEHHHHDEEESEALGDAPDQAA